MGIAKRIGTPLSPSATKVMLLGCGELGKEVIIALQRLGCEVIGVDRYPDAPGMQVARINPSMWAITARGFNSQFAHKLLVLIDGRSVYTPL